MKKKLKVESVFKWSIIAVVVSNIFDAMFTIITILFFGITAEANPFMRMLFSQYGILPTTLIKLTFPLLALIPCLAWVHWSSVKYPHLEKSVKSFASLCFMVVLIHYSFALASHILLWMGM